MFSVNIKLFFSLEETAEGKIVVVFPGIVCVSVTGDEDFKSKDLEVLRSTRASVKHH